MDVAYVGAKGVGGYAALDINAPLTLGGGDASRPYAPLGRFIAINSWGQRLDTRYNSLQVALNKPFTHGFLFKGAYTLSKAMNETDDDGRATLTWNTPSEVYRNWAPAGFDRTAQLHRSALPTSCRGRAPVATTACSRRIINDWQMNGVFAAFSGTPFTVTASGTSLNTPSNHADGRSRRVVRHESARLAPLARGSIRPRSAQPTGVRFGNTGRNQFYGPGGYILDFSVFRTFPIGGEKQLEFRLAAGNVLNHAVFGNPQGSITSGTFGQITGANDANYPARQIVLGLRFQF